MKTLHNFTDDWGNLFIVLALVTFVPSTLTGVLLYYV
jgi:hypothetical protein